MDLPKAIAERIKDGYKMKRKVRSDAVRYNTHVLTGSHKEMKELEQNPEKFEKWIKANLDFVEKEFGKENIVRFSLHLDEKTPHIHAVTVPITEKGGLSSRQVMGGPKEFRERQTRYAEAMQEFGLQRGLKREGIKHEDAKDYYARISQPDEIKEIEVKKNLLGFSSTKQYKKALEESTDQLKTAFRKVAEYKKKLEREKAVVVTKQGERKEFFEQKERTKAEELRLSKLNSEREKQIQTLAYKAEDILAHKKKDAQELWKNLTYRIADSQDKLDIQDMDNIIREEARKHNPNENPWTTFDQVLGREMEGLLNEIGYLHNEKLERERNAKEKAQVLREQRQAREEEQKKDESKRSKGRGRSW